MAIPLCYLCKTQSADKTNSHIISKFLCKRLFEFTAPRHTLMIGKNGGSRKIQDTAKENNILCSRCEKRMEVIETHFARIIDDIHNFSDFPEKFVLHNKLNQTHFLECPEINPTLFKLFVFSLVWRVSTSAMLEYQMFKLPNKAEEELRIFLDLNLTDNLEELLNAVRKPSRIPQYHFCFLKPYVKSDKSRGMLTAYNIDGSRHFLLVIDFAIFFFSSDKLKDPVLRKVSNKQNETVIIGLGENEGWTELNQNVLRKMLGQGN